MSRLNFGQGNALSSSLTVIGDFITTMRAVLGVREGTHFLKYEDIPDIHERRSILDTLEMLTQELRSTEELFGLDVPPVNVRKKIHHQAALLAAELGDMRSKALKRYGPVDSSIAPELDAAVGRIISLLHQL
jgi:hypothetical protein